eukprot:7381706-Prymnesium_polylepis.1
MNLQTCPCIEYKSSPGRIHPRNPDAPPTLITKKNQSGRRPIMVMLTSSVQPWPVRGRPRPFAFRSRDPRKGSPAHSHTRAARFAALAAFAAA